MKNAPIGMGLVLIVGLGACTRMGRLPMPTETDGLHASSAGNSSDGQVSSVLLRKGQLPENLHALMPGAERFRVARFPDRELFLGYTNGEPRPDRVASLSRIGDKRGSLVLGVGVERNGQRPTITRVITHSPQGRLQGLQSFQANCEQFLAQFAGRSANGDLAEVDAITGATAITEALRDVVRQEAARLAGILNDEARLDAIQELAQGPEPGGSDPGETESAKGQPRSGGALFGGQAEREASGKRDWVSAAALGVEIFLFAAVVAVVIGQELRRRRR